MTPHSHTLCRNLQDFNTKKKNLTISDHGSPWGNIPSKGQREFYQRTWISDVYPPLSYCISSGHDRDTCPLNSWEGVEGFTSNIKECSSTQSHLDIHFDKTLVMYTFRELAIIPYKRTILTRPRGAGYSGRFFLEEKTDWWFTEVIGWSFILSGRNFLPRHLPFLVVVQNLGLRKEQEVRARKSVTTYTSI